MSSQISTVPSRQAAKSIMKVTFSIAVKCMLKCNAVITRLLSSSRIEVDNWCVSASRDMAPSKIYMNHFLFAPNIESLHCRDPVNHDGKYFLLICSTNCIKDIDSPKNYMQLGNFSNMAIYPFPGVTDIHSGVKENSMRTSIDI